MDQKFRSIPESIIEILRREARYMDKNKIIGLSEENKELASEKIRSAIHYLKRGNKNII